MFCYLFKYHLLSRGGARGTDLPFRVLFVLTDVEPAFLWFALFFGVHVGKVFYEVKKISHLVFA